LCGLMVIGMSFVPSCACVMFQKYPYGLRNASP
jgi:hypothetical protein